MSSKILELKSGDKEESGIFINHLSTPPLAKRCYSTSGKVIFTNLATQFGGFLDHFPFLPFKRFVCTGT